MAVHGRASNGALPFCMGQFISSCSFATTLESPRCYGFTFRNWPVFTTSRDALPLTGTMNKLPRPLWTINSADTYGDISIGFHEFAVHAARRFSISNLNNTHTMKGVVIPKQRNRYTFAKMVTKLLLALPHHPLAPVRFCR
jgi:hypothetical protein